MLTHANISFERLYGMSGPPTTAFKTEGGKLHCSLRLVQSTVHVLKVFHEELDVAQCMMLVQKEAD